MYIYGKRSCLKCSPALFTVLISNYLILNSMTKTLLITLLISLFCFTTKAQETFQTTFPYFNGEANGELLLIQSDGYIVSGVAKKDIWYLSLIKTGFEGDTLWTKDIDLGLTGLGSCYGVSDIEGNLYISVNRMINRIDNAGNLVWSHPLSNIIMAVQLNDTDLWVCTAGQYLYKFNTSTGDSIWRSDAFAESNSFTSSLTINSSGDIMATVSDKDFYMGFPYASELYYLSNNSDSVINIPFDSGVELVIMDTKYINNEYYSVGHELHVPTNDQPQIYMVRYNSAGTLLSTHEFVFPYYSYGFYKMAVNENNQLVVMGGVRETPQSDEKILLHCTSLEGDSIWTSVNGLDDGTIGFDLKTTSDGGCLVSGSIEGVQYNTPYLLKTNSLGIITGIQSPIMENQRAFVYPNPSTDEVVFETAGFIGGIIRITSSTGKLISEFKITSDKTVLPVINFPRGVCFYTFIKEYKIVSGKLILK